MHLIGMRMRNKYIYNHESGSYTGRRRRNITFTAEGTKKLEKNLNSSKASDPQSDTLYYSLLGGDPGRSL